MTQRIKIPMDSTEASVHDSPIVAIRGRAWLEETLNSVVGMWRDRVGIDPVAWQRKLRSEWERSTIQRKRPIRKKRSRQR